MSFFAALIISKSFLIFFISCSKTFEKFPSPIKHSSNISFPVLKSLIIKGFGSLKLSGLTIYEIIND